MDEEQKNNLENNVVNEEVKEETVTEVSTEPATPVETPTEAPVDETQAPLEQLAAQAAQNSVPVEEPTTTPDVNSVNTEEKKKGNKIVPIICVIVLLAGICAGLYFCTDIFKGKDKDKENEEVQQPVQPDTSLSSKFEGIYTAKEDNMYIHKKTDDEFYYTIGGNFQGVAKVEGETAKEENSFNDGKYFEFKLVDGGIEVIYHAASENESVAADTGVYKKVAEYSKDNVYKYAVGDPKYLNEKYSGVFTNEDIEFRLIQKNDKEVMVDLETKADSNLPLLTETFKIESDNHLVAKSFFDETKTAYEITFKDKTFTFKAHTDVFGVDEDTKKLEKTYTFSKALTQDEIISEYYSYY